MDARAPQTNAPKPRRPRGRQLGSHITPGLKRLGARKDLTARKDITPKDLVPLGDNSGPARFFRKMVKDITRDIGPQRELSRITAELIRSFAGCATLMQVRNVEIALGETTEVDVQEYAALASTMLRLASRLGLTKKSRREETLDDFLDDFNKNRRSNNDEAAQAPSIEGDVVPAAGNDAVAGDEL